MEALYLYSQVMPYTIEGIEALISISKIKIHLVHYPIPATAPYQLPSIDGISYHIRNEISNTEIFKMIDENDFKFIFVTGWANKDYLYISKYARKKSIPVITGCDTQWRGDFRQIVAVIFSKIFIRKYFNYIMVPGFYQFEYARLLGYKRNNILYPLYVANIFLFSQKYKECLAKKNISYPHNILYVGRFEKIKGIELLINTFKSIENRNGWTLTLIGNGSLKNKIINENNNDQDIMIKDFLQPEELAKVIEHTGAFCLPSENEPWGVVIQEFAAAGLPLLTTDVCGASKIFLRENFNGFIFKSNDEFILKEKLINLINMQDEELLLFSKRSNQLAHSITADMYAANFFQFLET